MKKAICILLSLCVLLPLIGCHVQPTEDPTVPSTEAAPGASTAAEATLPEADPWYSKIRWFGRNDNPRDHSNEWSQPVLEMPEAFYYIGDDGLYRYDKQSGQDDLLIRGDIQGLFRYEGKVYYSTPQQICCLTDASGGSSVVWDSCLYPDSDEYLKFCLIVDFQLYDGSLYIKIDGIHAIRYVLETGQTEHFLDDCQADANFNYFTFYEGDCFYIEHANRSFSIRRMDMDSGEAAVVRTDGKGRYDPNKLRFDGLVSYNGDLYYFIRFTGDIFKFHSEGNDEMILDVSALEMDLDFLHCPYNQNLCYYIWDGTRYLLYEYDAMGNHKLLLATESTFAYRFFVVTESAVFWRESESGIVHCDMK